MARITVSLKATEREALRVLAEREFRDPRAQAAIIIRRELERAGLLAAADGRPETAQAVEVGRDPQPA
jgi:hypothetical protein